MSSLVITLITMTMPRLALAHCPLCTIGAGALAIFAASIGVSTASIGVFIGAFALALGLWIARTIRKQYMKYQDVILAIVIFLVTIIPIMPFIVEYRSFSIFIVGDYGSFLNRTYLVNQFLLGSMVGGLFLAISPIISSALTNMRKRSFIPYQGMIITFSLLILTALFFQFVV